MVSRVAGRCEEARKSVLKPPRRDLELRIGSCGQATPDTCLAEPHTELFIPPEHLFTSARCLLRYVRGLGPGKCTMLQDNTAEDRYRQVSNRAMAEESKCP